MGFNVKNDEVWQNVCNAAKWHTHSCVCVGDNLPSRQPCQSHLTHAATIKSSRAPTINIDCSYNSYNNYNYKQTPLNGKAIDRSILQGRSLRCIPTWATIDLYSRTIQGPCWHAVEHVCTSQDGKNAASSKSSPSHGELSNFSAWKKILRIHR